MIELRQVRKCFGEVTAADDISFVARDGEVTGLLGPNGAGKTTALRVLSGLLAPTRGSARIDDIDVHDSPSAARARLGMLPDARGLFPRMSTREHLAYAGALYGMKKRAVDDEIAALSDALGLASLLDRKVDGFSQGERVKVALGRALIHRPKNVVLDEPTNGLDVGATRAMRRLIRALKAEGKCVVFSSHIMQEVKALCDRIVIVSKGAVVAEGSPEEITEAAQAKDLEAAFVALTGLDDT